MWMLPAPIFFCLTIFFAGRLGKEIFELGIVDSSPSLISLEGLYRYIVEKRKRGERLSFNLWASIGSFILIFSPFVYLGVYGG